eukprot:TRINITY_DN5172_c0_g1_i1.p1 TRINITY_DN5172_c0_g1~~TRINITY_DN5172_c0_g1_i1.p1  ORF type:complete len:193 (-),score=12.46 TRINITY_DN5172_c0_g1_i1:244-822(-)
MSSDVPKDHNKHSNLYRAATGEFAGNATGYPDVIALSSYPSVLPTSGSFQVTVQYSANVERDIVVDILRLPDYAWFGKGITFVPAGASSLQLTITISGSIPVGTNYELKGWIAPRGQGSAPNVRFSPPFRFCVFGCFVWSSKQGANCDRVMNLLFCITNMWYLALCLCYFVCVPYCCAVRGCDVVMLCVFSS